MSWTLAQIAIAAAALPAGTSDADAAGLLAAATTSLAGQPFLLAEAILIAQESGNFSWARIGQRAQAMANIPPETPLDVAILAARTLITLSPQQIVDPGVPGAWAAWQAGIAALSDATVADLSAADVSSIAALSAPVVASWRPAPTQLDVAAARHQQGSA